MLVFKRMRQFMSHHHALVGQRAPVCDVEFARLGIVEPLNLLREHVHHEGIEIESLGKQAKGFRAALVGVAFGGVLFFVHLLDDVSANFLARTQRFFQRRDQFEAGDLAHLAENFVGGRDEIGIRGGLGIRRGWSDGRFLCVGGATEEKGKAQKESGQPEIYVFPVKDHIVFRIAESRLARLWRHWNWRRRVTSSEYSQE